LRYVETNTCNVFINTMLINNTKHLVNCFSITLQMSNLKFSLQFLSAYCTQMQEE
jgi:hypothetical protein